MAVLHWLGGPLRTAEARGLQWVYSPVAQRPGAPRPQAPGTPEIFFAKSIDNSRLVKAADPVRNREMAGFAASVAVCFLLMMFYAFQHFRAIEYGYQIEAQKRQREELIEANRAFRLEEASLRAPERIDVLARRMGLESPRAGQVLRLESTVEPQGGLMARVSDVAVITVTH